MPTNKEILEKAINKAIDGGFNLKFGNFKYVATDDLTYQIFDAETEEFIASTAYEAVVYSKPFAKALWQSIPKIGVMSDELARKQGLLGWQYHLQNMVISDDPIKYLGENI